MVKKIFDKEYWKNYTIGYYAGIAAAIAILIWVSLPASWSWYIRGGIAGLLYILTYFILGIVGQSVYKNWIGSKR